MTEARDARGRRVVVTGMGAMTSLGCTVAQYWQGLVSGRSGAGPISQFDPSTYPTRIAAEVWDFDPLNYMEQKEARRMSRFSQLAVAATGAALADARLQITPALAERTGVLIGTGIGGLSNIEHETKTMMHKGGMRVSPYLGPMMLPNSGSAQVSRAFGLKGYSSTIITACAAGTQSIGEAAEAIRRGAVDVMVAGGSEAAICEIGMACFAVMRALTTRNDEPAGASRPFDANRDGFLPGEGARGAGAGERGSTRCAGELPSSPRSWVMAALRMLTIW